EGLYRSTNSGQTFTLLNGPNSDEFSLGVRVGRYLYGVTAADPGGGSGQLKRVSMDDPFGAWAILRPNFNVSGFAVDPDPAKVVGGVATTVWACEGTTARVVSDSATPGRLMKTTNAHLATPTWTEVQKNGRSLSPTKVYIDPFRPSVMLIASYFEDPNPGDFQGTMISTDSGVNWSVAPQLPSGSVRGHFIYGGVPGRVYAMPGPTGTWRLDGLYVP
ncbi:MAG: hypothetical protein ACREH8_22860, partial [Opitutaceae bacterium]